MGVKIQILKDGKVIFETPLTFDDPDLFGLVEKGLEEIRNELDDLREFYDVLSNERRLQMLLDFIRDEEKRFSDFFEYGMNPKTIYANLKMMTQGKLITQVGRKYRLSSTGLGGFLTASIVLRKVLNELKKVEGEKEEKMKIPIE